MDLKSLLEPAGISETLAELISINSVNPAFHGPGESEIAAYVANFFQGAGIPCEVQEIEDRRGNVIGRIEGSEAGCLIIFDAHADTASAVDMSIDPFRPVCRDGRMFGRGACDTKAGLAAMMHAARIVARQKERPRATIWIVATADEEYSLKGIRRLAASVSAEAAVVSEPTELRPIVASKGCLRWRINVRGRAAHSSKPHLGVNAIAKMCRLVLGVEQGLSARLLAQAHPLVGPPTVNVGLIQGGAQVNFVPETCSICVDRRTVPGESRGSVLAEFQDLINQLAGQDPEFRADMEEPILDMAPLETPADSRVARLAARIAGEVAGSGGAGGVPFGSNANELGAAGVPAIVLGPGCIDQAHSAEEFVDLDQVVKATEIYARIMLEY